MKTGATESQIYLRVWVLPQNLIHPPQTSSGDLAVIGSKNDTRSESKTNRLNVSTKVHHDSYWEEERKKREEFPDDDWADTRTTRNLIVKDTGKGSIDSMHHSNASSEGHTDTRPRKNPFGIKSSPDFRAIARFKVNEALEDLAKQKERLAAAFAKQEKERSILNKQKEDRLAAALAKQEEDRLAALAKQKKDRLAAALGKQKEAMLAAALAKQKEEDRRAAALAKQKEDELAAALAKQKEKDRLLAPPVKYKEKDKRALRKAKKRRRKRRSSNFLHPHSKYQIPTGGCHQCKVISRL